MASRIIKELRAGHVRLTVWEHEGKRRSVTIARLYKDKETGQWKSTEGLAIEDLPDLVTCALEANRLLRLEERDEATVGTNVSFKRV
jgi:hypothetical protein